MLDDIRVRKLDNGARLVVDQRPHAASTALGVWVTTGSRDETPEQAGLAHALEHMAFKGSQRRSGEEIARAIDAVGGELDAYTSREATAFYAQVLPEDLGLGLDLVTDLALRPALRGEDWQLEADVICHEIAQTLDTPDDILFDYFQETCYPGHALGRSILGSEASVQALTIGDFKEFRAQHYRPDKLIFAASGPLELAEFEAAVAPHLEAVFPANAAASGAQAGPGFNPGRFLQARAMEQAQIVFGWPSVAQSDPRSYAYVLLSHMLGYGGASHLFMDIRERRGLAYMVYASSQFFSDAGQLFVHASTGAGQVPAYLQAVGALMRALPGLLSEEDLQRAKAQFRAGTLMARDSVNANVRAVAHHLAWAEEPKRLEEILQQVEAISLAEVRSLAEQLTAKPALTAIAPKSSLAALEDWHEAFAG
jgi:predicted Zn-dependent peptidase